MKKEIVLLGQAKRWLCNAGLQVTFGHRVMAALNFPTSNNKISTMVGHYVRLSNHQWQLTILHLSWVIKHSITLWSNRGKNSRLSNVRPHNFVLSDQNFAWVENFSLQGKIIICSPAVSCHLTLTALWLTMKLICRLERREILTCQAPMEFAGSANGRWKMRHILKASVRSSITLFNNAQKAAMG